MGCAASVRRVSAEEFSDPMTVVQPSAALATSASSASSLSDLPSEFPLMSSLSDSLDAQPKGVESRRVAFSVTSVQVGEDTFQEVDFEDEQLTSFRSWDQKHDETFDGPLGVPLPPGSATAWDIRLTPAGERKLRATVREAPARLRPGTEYTIRIEATPDRILFSRIGATASLRRNWYLQRRARPKCPQFSNCPVPKYLAENSEANARLTQLYFRAWTLNGAEESENVPFLGHLLGKHESWEDSLRNWLQRLPCAETKRNVGNFLSVYRVRPHAEADGNSDDDGADEPIVLTTAQLPGALRTQLPAQRRKKNSAQNDEQGNRAEEAIQQADTLWCTPIPTQPPTPKQSATYEVICCAAARKAVAWPGARPDAAASPYHAFAAAAPHILKKPEQWPGAPSSSSTVRLLWDEQALYVCWELHGKVASPVQLKENPTLQGPLKGLPAEQCSLLFDERVECFLWQPTEGGNPSDTYYAFEINHDGKALTNRARFGGIFGFDWDSSDAFSVWTDELPLATEADPSSASCFASRVVIAEFRWKALGFDITSEIRIGLHRAQHPAHLKTRDMDKKEMDALLNEMIWSSWVDPHDAVVNFHRPEMFGKLILKSGHEHESFAAARLLGSKVLRVLRSPKLLLDDCPPGSLLIRVKYASLCGSDFPFFRRRPSSSLGSLYWDRDGFCGHEAIGVVLDSRSDRFAIGDAVLALPSSYFKAHASSRAEWFDENVHNVLLENMPVRGGFAEIFTSHELYAYKISECVPRMLLAQALGSLLCMLRRLGSLIGQTVVILGQGQNGLMTTRLLSQMCLRHLIAVEPLEFRRRQARRFGAGRAVAPGEALTAVKAVAPKGADLVLEMETINEALDLVRSGGTVVAFGVPDDPVYNFHYGKFFRKNVTLMASVFPDPGVDFPAAVELLETGRFDTEGIITHTFPLVEIQKAFTLATEYQDDVIKVVLDVSDDIIKVHEVTSDDDLMTTLGQSDAIIIGAGVIGNSIALELSRNGWRTLNIDKLRGSGQGSTGYSSGICRMMYSLLDSVKFAWEGYTYFENWEDHIGLKDELSPANADRGYGLRLPQPLGAVRLFSWTSKADVGTVLILHGMEDDWLGNNGSEGLVPGGAAEIAQSLHEKGFSVVLLDSFFDGRRERLLEEGIDRRVSDTLAAIAFLESRNFPSPFHLYGKSEGSWAVLRLLTAPERGGRVASEAKWAKGCLSSCLCDLAGVDGSDPEEESLLAALEKTPQPPLLLLADMSSKHVAQRVAEAAAQGARAIEETLGMDPPGGLARLRRCGALVLRSPQSQLFLERVVASHEAVGLPFEHWSSEEIQQRLAFDMQRYGPQVRIDDESFGEPTGAPLGDGVYFPTTGYVSDPMLAACNLQAAAEATGNAQFSFGQTVTEILQRNGRVAGVRCGTEELEAPVVVNVAGPHSSQITGMALGEKHDMTISTRPMRQEVAYVASPPEVSWDDGGEGLVCTDMDAGVYFRPEVGGKILVGSVEPSCDENFHIYPSDPEAVYPGRELASLTDQWTNQVYRLALRIPTLPLPEAGNVQGCAACYDVTEDWVPIYDKSALPGFYMAIGTSGNQFKNAGVAGRLMRELIEAGESGLDTDAKPLDFQMKRIPCGGSISSSTFSRKRELLQTSGSVLG
ncbi:Uncharacterized zinc-type alcohol dehydrogenase-like protein YdjJ [Durusdinium trenchii]|uniref:Uncharacterized zinc-type alcohol dehydrogenase-like protein YdjJ n=1 Tax=Durusdinium trenchii TaxID=1381693 RepID=A0ABP0R063_9DINO